MMQARLMNILRAPVITEKSELVRKSNTTVFKVLPDATKERAWMHTGYLYVPSCADGLHTTISAT